MKEIAAVLATARGPRPHAFRYVGNEKWKAAIEGGNTTAPPTCRSTGPRRLREGRSC